MRFFHRSAALPTTETRLVVGLGNIGRPYLNTRHNIGFEVVDEFARRYNARFRSGKCKGEEAVVSVNGVRVMLLKPSTLMNLSGDAVSAAARFYKIPSSQILVVCDDVNLPLGKVRLRARGSDGGHNGLWHIINRLGTQDFPRLRIGVGEKPSQMEMVDYVLGHFLGHERSVMNAARDVAADAIETWVSEGIEAAMNRWNASPAGS